MTDEKIDSLLKNSAPRVSADFTERTMASVAADRARTARIDAFCDALLRRSPAPELSPDFTERAIAAVRSRARYGWAGQWNRFASALAAAACLTVGVFSVPLAARGVVGEKDFAEMTRLADEIADISEVVSEQEFLSLLQ